MKAHQLNMELAEQSVKLYSLNKAAALLGIGWTTLMTLIDKGEIVTVTVLNRQKISLGELQRFVTQCPKSIPVIPPNPERAKEEQANKRIIECASIDQIFNRIKKEVLQNEKAKKTYLSK